MKAGSYLQASSSDRYVTQVIIDHLGVRPEDIGMHGSGLDVVAHVRDDVTVPLTNGEEPLEEARSLAREFDKFVGTVA